MSGIPAVSPAEAGIFGVGPRGTVSQTPGLSVEARRNFICDVAAGGSGGTYGPAAGYRYIVGGFADSVVIRASASASQRAASAAEYLSGRDFGPADGVGFWRDPQTGRTWLDVVRGFDSRDKALTVGLCNGELSVWDDDAEQEIRL